MDLKIGMRLLVKMKTCIALPFPIEEHLSDYSDVYEVCVEAISPSGRYIKLIHEMDEETNWFQVEKIVVVEVLKDNPND